ncbi:MAG: hypothetical protein J6P45_07780 [Lachnospiraceae bacterium]|nr:hypothetical protein [Lachnospiraceae bacterium]
MKIRRIIKIVTAMALSVSMLFVSAPAEVSAAKEKIGVKGAWVPSPVEGVLMYALPNGTFLTDGFTSDGYYVNKNGFWAPSWSILNSPIPSRNSWLTSSAVGDFEGLIPIMKGVQRKLSGDLHGFRVISVYSSHMALFSVDSSGSTSRKKTTRLALYKNPDFDGYTVQVCTPLSGDEREMTDDAGEWNSMALYDYQVLRAFMYCISRSGDKVSEAIYSSWMDNNEYGLRIGEWVLVGDTYIRYVPSNGAGLYEIKAAF